MKSKTLYLHIGAAKTGTTAIQDFCLLNRKLLKKKGYLFPKLGLYGEAHHLLGHAWGVGWMPQHMIDDLVPADIWAQARTLFQRNDSNLIISSETLTSTFMQKPESMREIKQLFNGCPVIIILYLRRQDLHAQSLYNQCVKTGHTDKKFNPEKLPKFYDYYNFLVSIVDVFGKENVIVRPYEKGQFRDGNIFSDFLSSLGIIWSNEFVMPEKKSNPRLGREALEFLRIANSVERSWERKLQFNKFISQLDVFKESEGVCSDSILSEIDQKAIISRYEKSNRKVAREFFGRDDEILFYENVSGEKKYKNKSELYETEMDRAVQIVIEIWEKDHEENIYPTMRRALKTLILALAHYVEKVCMFKIYHIRPCIMVSRWIRRRRGY